MAAEALVAAVEEIAVAAIDIATLRHFKNNVDLPRSRETGCRRQRCINGDDVSSESAFILEPTRLAIVRCHISVPAARRQVVVIRRRYPLFHSRNYHFGSW